MTRDDIIRMAVQCQLVTTANRDGIYMDALSDFAALVAAAERDVCLQQIGIIVEAEREACAKVCEHKMPNPVCNWSEAQIVEALRECADAIRARDKA